MSRLSPHIQLDGGRTSSREADVEAKEAPAKAVPRGEGVWFVVEFARHDGS